MISFRNTVVALALALGLQVSASAALEPDELDGDQLSASIWTTYNPDPNAQVSQQGSVHLVDLPEGNAHQMWHKPSGALDSDGWSHAYRTHQPLSCPLEKYEVEGKLSDQPTVGKKCQLIGLFIGYDGAETNRQWPFHMFSCISSDSGVYVIHHSIKETSYTNGGAKQVLTCPNVFRLKHDGNHHKLSAICPGSSALSLIQDSIVSDAGTCPKHIGLFVGNMKHNNNPVPAFSTGVFPNCG